MRCSMRRSSGRWLQVPVDHSLGPLGAGVEQVRALEKQVALPRVDDKLAFGCRSRAIAPKSSSPCPAGVQRSCWPWITSVGVVHRCAWNTGERLTNWQAGSDQAPCRIASA